MQQYPGKLLKMSIVVLVRNIRILGADWFSCQGNNVLRPSEGRLGQEQWLSQGCKVSLLRDQILHWVTEQDWNTKWKWSHWLKMFPKQGLTLSAENLLGMLVLLKAKKVFLLILKTYRSPLLRTRGRLGAVWMSQARSTLLQQQPLTRSRNWPGSGRLARNVHR